MKSALAIHVLLLGAATALPAPPPSAPGRVVRVVEPAAIRDSRPDPALIQGMVEAALVRLTGAPHATAAMRAFVSPSDTVAIRVNAAGGPTLATKHPLVGAVLGLCRRAGVPPERLIVWDRRAADLERAGFTSAAYAGRATVLAVFPGAGYDGGEFVMSPELGQLIWGDHEFRGRKPNDRDLLEETLRKRSARPEDSPGTPEEPRQVSSKSYFTTLLTRRATRIINLPVLTDHPGVGLEGCVAGLALAAVDNHRRFFDTWGNPGLAEVFARKPIRDKAVLHIMDGLMVQFAGGPEFVAHYSDPAGLLLVGTDPVAIDAVAFDLIEKLRATRQLPSIAEARALLQTASGLGLGTADLAKIQILDTARE